MSATFPSPVSLVGALATGVQETGLADEIKTRLRSFVAQQLLRSSSGEERPTTEAQNKTVEDAERPWSRDGDMLLELGALTSRIQQLGGENKSAFSVLRQLLDSVSSAYKNVGPEGALSMTVAPVAASATLALRLAETEMRHSGATEIAELRASFAARMCDYQRSVDLRADEEVQARVASLKAREVARVQAEERLRFEGELVQMRRELEETKLQEMAKARAEVDREIDSLRRTREMAAASSSDLRGRLLDDLDSIAGRDASARHAAAQEARTLRLERQRSDETQQLLSARATEAEDGARHAEVKARLAFERWKAEASLALEERERMLERSERRAREETQAAESERRTNHDKILQMPQLVADYSNAQHLIEDLRKELSIARNLASDSAAQASSLSVAVEAERSARADLDKRLAVAESQRSRTDSDLAVARSSSETCSDEWSAAVHLLRDKLASALNKMKRMSQETASEREIVRKRFEEVEASSQKRLIDAETIFSREVAAHETRHAAAQSKLAAEQRRSDEMAAHLAGSQQRCSDLQRTVDGLRSQLSNSSVRAVATGSSTASANAVAVVSSNGYVTHATSLPQQHQPPPVPVRTGPAAVAAATVLAKGPPTRPQIPSGAAIAATRGAAAQMAALVGSVGTVQTGIDSSSDLRQMAAPPPLPLTNRGVAPGLLQLQPVATPGSFLALLVDWNSTALSAAASFAEQQKQHSQLPMTQQQLPLQSIQGQSLPAALPLAAPFAITNDRSQKDSSNFVSPVAASTDVTQTPQSLQLARDEVMVMATRDLPVQTSAENEPLAPLSRVPLLATNQSPIRVVPILMESSRSDSHGLDMDMASFSPVSIPSQRGIHGLPTPESGSPTQLEKLSKHYSTTDHVEPFVSGATLALQPEGSIVSTANLTVLPSSQLLHATISSPVTVPILIMHMPDIEPDVAASDSSDNKRRNLAGRYYPEDFPESDGSERRNTGLKDTESVQVEADFGVVNGPADAEPEDWF